MIDVCGFMTLDAFRRFSGSLDDTFGNQPQWIVYFPSQRMTGRSELRLPRVSA